MEEHTPPPTLLDDLEARQDQVIGQLDDLNHRIEGLLEQLSGSRPGADSTSNHR